MNKPSRSLALLVGAIAVATMSAVAGAGEVRAGGGSFSTSGGKSGTYSRQSERSNASMSRQQSVTTSEGKTLSRSAGRQYDPETNSVTRSVTGRGGNTRSASAMVDQEAGAITVSGNSARGRSGSMTIDPDR